jgi:hypothetical protein
MAQITLYLTDATAEALACAAEREHLSRSAWVSRLINERLAAEEREAKISRILSLAGSWPDDGRPIEEIMAELRPPWPERELNFE